MLAASVSVFFRFDPFASMTSWLSSDAGESLPHYPADVRTTSVEGHRIAFVDRGAGPVVLFVHGLGSNLSLWRSHLNALAEGRRVLALDLPGFGQSAKDDVPGSMAFFADIIAAFLDARGIERVSLVGVSMGGQVAFTFALRHPGRVRHLAAVSPAGIEDFSSSEASALKALMTPEAIAAANAAQVRQNVALNFHQWSEEHAWLIEQRHAIAQRSDFSGYVAANAKSVAGMLDAPVRHRLGAISAPVLLLFGASDQLIPNPYLHPQQKTATVARAAETRLPHADVHLVQRAGHLMMLERPDVFRKRLRTFLNT